MFNNIGSVSNIFLFIILIIVAIGVLVIPSSGVWRDTAKSLCVMEQSSHLRSLEYAVKNAKEKDAVYPEFKLKVMYCVDCIWYNTSGLQLMVKISGQDTPVAFPIKTNFQEIGCDCDNCDQEGDVDGDDQPEKCANLRMDTTYTFEITKDYAKLTGYIDNEGNFESEGTLSCNPCGPCADYDEECGKIDSQITPCCSGMECKERPDGLIEVDWQGDLKDDSTKSWDGRICLKSLGEECLSYTECSFFQLSQAGPTKGHYPCHSIGNDPTNRCCYPLQLKVRVDEGTIYPGADCGGVGGCEIYCGDVKCGYVYGRNADMKLERFPDMCCKPLGEECVYTQYNWQCCAHELLDGSIGESPTRCLQDDGNFCPSGSTNCYCCISPGYNCTFDTASYCCDPNNYQCENITNNLPCGEGEACKCQ